MIHSEATSKERKKTECLRTEVVLHDSIFFCKKIEIGILMPTSIESYSLSLFGVEFEVKFSYIGTLYFGYRVRSLLEIKCYKQAVSPDIETICI